MPQDRGRFSVVSPKSDDGITISGVRYGPQDESTRINLATILAYDKSSGSAGANEPATGNTYAHVMLMGLPGMTDEVADAILEWIDPTGNQRPNGPGSQYYGSLSPPYAERNGPPTSIEELLLIKGVTPRVALRAGCGEDGPREQFQHGQRVGRRRGQLQRRDGPRLGRLPDFVERRRPSQE